MRECCKSARLFCFVASAILFSSHAPSAKKVEVPGGGKKKLCRSMSSAQSLQVNAVIKARELILLALENADSVTLQHLICLQDMIKNLNFERLLEEIKKREQVKDQG